MRSIRMLFGLSRVCARPRFPKSTSLPSLLRVDSNLYTPDSGLASFGLPSSLPNTLFSILRVGSNLNGSDGVLAIYTPDSGFASFGGGGGGGFAIFGGGRGGGCLAIFGGGGGGFAIFGGGGGGGRSKAILG
eukprot:gene11520-biopygen15689